MNIFYLDRNPELAARLHCNQHISKMVVETAQLLSTAHHMARSASPDGIYKITHVNHPSAIWVRRSIHHYEWTLALFLDLCSEYHRRYNRVHKTFNLAIPLSEIPDLKHREFTDPPQCMPDECKHDDCVTAYTQYYKYKSDQWVGLSRRPMYWS